MKKNVTVLKIKVGANSKDVFSFTGHDIKMVEWGDGNYDKLNTGEVRRKNLSHIYKQQGEYIVSIHGGKLLFFDKKYIIEIIQLSNTLDDCSYMFAGCYNIKSIAGLVIPNSVTKTNYMFNKCTKLSNIDNIKFSEKMTECKNMFEKCSKLTTINNLKLSDSILNCGSMFFNSGVSVVLNLTLGKNLLSCFSMFKSSKLEYIDEVNLPNEVSVCAEMFANTNLKHIPKIYFGTKIVHCQRMFMDCKNITRVENFNLPKTLNKSCCTGSMFHNCNNLNYVSLVVDTYTNDIANIFGDNCNSLKTIIIHGLEYKERDGEQPKLYVDNYLSNIFDTRLENVEKLVLWNVAQKINYNVIAKNLPNLKDIQIKKLENAVYSEF